MFRKSSNKKSNDETSVSDLVAAYKKISCLYYEPTTPTPATKTSTNQEKKKKKKKIIATTSI